VADGVIAHVFCTPRYLAEALLPAVRSGATEAGRSPEEVMVVAPVFVVTGRNAMERALVASAVRGQIAFYGSTPAYRGVLELAGRADVADRLHALSVSRDPGRWGAMAELVDDDLLAEFAVVTDTPADAPRLLAERYAGLADRVVIGAPPGGDPTAWFEAIGPIPA
jgi:alkanesulfonate monooxygenase SsuD/methylene tetrahydromethanopterin reductase-like flavin-dependent oxidoreductase (luciferase family)